MHQYQNSRTGTSSKPTPSGLHSSAYPKPYTTSQISGHSSGYSNTKEKSLEPQISIDVNFSNNIKQIESLFPGYQSQSTDKIRNNFDCYVRIDGHNAKTLFSIGFFLAQDIVSRASTFDARNLQKILLASISAFHPNIKGEPMFKSRLAVYHSKLDNLFVTASRVRGQVQSPLDDPAEAAKFLVSECKKDKELATVFVYMARCTLGYLLQKDDLHRKLPMMFSKITNIGWEAEDNFSADFYKIVCMPFDYSVNLYTITDFRCEEKAHGTGSNKVEILDYSSRVKEFKAILYRSTGSTGSTRETQNSTPLSSQDSILSRYKDSAMETDSKNSLSQSKGSTNVPEPYSPVSEVVTCNLCGQEIIKRLVYTNACGHNYCYYCVTDLIDAHPGLKFCFLKKCPRNMSQNELKRFLEKCNDREKLNKQPSMTGVPEEGPINMHPQNITPSATRNNRTIDEAPSITSQSSKLMPKKVSCTMCTLEINETNPIVYTNDTCSHSFCKNCISVNKLPYDGVCLKPRCGLPLNFEKFKGALDLSGIPSFLVKCNKCFKTVDARKIFVNPSCQHRFCLSCTETARNVYCLLSSCPSRLDEDALFLFKQGLIAQEEFKASESKVVDCPSCKHQVTLYSYDESKAEYWKCPDCFTASCSKHNDTMSKCFCLCPKCLGNLVGALYDAKECHRCGISYCTKCMKENKLRETCACSLTTSKTVAEPKNGKVAWVKDRETNLRMHPNSCSHCGDFRDTPEFLKLSCDHRICEFCVMVHLEDFDRAKTKAIRCLKCQR